MTHDGKNIEECKFKECPAYRKDADKQERNLCPFFTDRYGGSSCWIINMIKDINRNNVI